MSLRIVVSGTQGQVVRSLLEKGPGAGADVVAIGRPTLDLADPRTVEAAIMPSRPDIIVSAAAMTDAERAEREPELAAAINAGGPGALAACARDLGIPIIHLSTDYVFDGTKGRPYDESDPVGPLSAYGRTKVAAEIAVAAAQPHHAILRTSWVYSPYSANFVTTMLQLATQRDEIRVVDDQTGNPTAAADVADGILVVARNLAKGQTAPERFGIFHMAGQSATTWADLATAVFACSAARGGPSARVVRITTSEYPSRIKRPPDSRLDCTKIAAAHGVALPPWQSSLPTCIDRFLERRT